MDMASILQSLRALSEPTRLRLLALLLEEELTVAELQESLGMGQSRISASLGMLRRQGLVLDRRVGKNIYYAAVHSAIAPLREAVAAAEEFRTAGDGFLDPFQISEELQISCKTVRVLAWRIRQKLGDKALPRQFNRKAKRARRKSA